MQTQPRQDSSAGQAGADRRVPAIVSMVLAWALCGCAGPTLEITSRPEAAAVFFDGVRQPKPEDETRDAAVMPLPYYGTAVVSSDVTRSNAWRETRELHTFDEPFSPWLFPLDFVLEWATYPFQPDRSARRIALSPTPRAKATANVLPADLPALRERARRAREAR